MGWVSDHSPHSYTNELSIRPHLHTPPTHAITTLNLFKNKSSETKSNTCKGLLVFPKSITFKETGVFLRDKAVYKVHNPALILNLDKMFRSVPSLTLGCYQVVLSSLKISLFAIWWMINSGYLRRRFQFSKQDFLFNTTQDTQHKQTGEIRVFFPSILFKPEWDVDSALLCFSSCCLFALLVKELLWNFMR